jgi:putative transposase
MAPVGSALRAGSGLFVRLAQDRTSDALSGAARPRRRALPKDDDERSASAIAPNVLDRQFTADQPNRKWIADFTHV